MNLVWIIENNRIQDYEREEWKQAFKNTNTQYYIVQRIPFSTTREEAYIDVPWIMNEVNKGSINIPIYHCTIEMAEQVRQWFDDRGLYYKVDEFKCSNYYKHIDDSIPLLNRDNILVSYKQLVKQWESTFLYFLSNCVFIRPDDGDKQFVGGSFMKRGIDLFTEQVDKYNTIDKNILCQISNSVTIKSEYRFVVIDGKVITGSQYKRDGIVDERIDYMTGAYELADKVAKQKWQIDKFYIVDVAELYDGSFSVIELNAGSCSGLYACNKEKIIKAMDVMFNK